MGIYELLRRRCKFIIAIDAEADSKLHFRSLNTLIRYAKIDFNINIDINLGDFQKNKHDQCKAHFALGKIDYGNDLTGYLLYLKSSLTGNERDYIQDYHKSHPSFPHESTADQFFTEQQFEAYRALGSHIAEDLFRKELDNHGSELPIHDFFKNLNTHLFI